MSDVDPDYVGAHEHGLLRIYSIDLPADEVSAFATKHIDFGDGDYWALQDWLGADTLDPEFVEFFDVADLGDVGLVGYLTAAHHIVDADIEANSATLGQLTGSVAIIRSPAFGGTEQHLMSPVEMPLNVENPLRHIATLKEVGAVVTFKPLPDAGAKGVIGETPQKKKPSDAAMGGRVATIALLVMALLVWVMIKVGG